MKDVKLKKHLIKIANNLTPQSTLEDVYKQLAMLSDIEESEQQEKAGEVFSQQEIRSSSKEWLK